MLPYYFTRIFTVGMLVLSVMVPGTECKKEMRAQEFNYPELVISLGSCCRTALRIREFQLNSWAYPFDWLLTRFDSMYKLLENDFKDFLAKDHIEDLKFWHTWFQEYWAPAGWHAHWVYDKQYDIQSSHDFPVESSIDEQHAAVLERYERRINRFYRATASGKTIYFIRREITKEQALKLDALLQKKFPLLNYVLVAIHNTDDFKEDWQLPRIKNFYLDDPLAKYNPIMGKYELYNPPDRTMEYARIFTQLGLGHVIQPNYFSNLDILNE